MWFAELIIVAMVGTLLLGLPFSIIDEREKKQKEEELFRKNLEEYLHPKDRFTPHNWRVEAARYLAEKEARKEAEIDAIMEEWHRNN